MDGDIITRELAQVKSKYSSIEGAELIACVKAMVQIKLMYVIVFTVVEICHCNLFLYGDMLCMFQSTCYARAGPIVSLSHTVLTRST